jgi:ribosomal RNA-processing protein 36
LEEYSSASEAEVHEDNDILEEEEDEEGESSSDFEVDNGDQDTAQNQLSHVSFGALSRAQEAMSGENNRKRKRGEEEVPSEQKSRLAAMRERLQELRERKQGRKGETVDQKVKATAKAKSRSGGLTGEGEAESRDAFFTNGDNHDDEDESDSGDSESQASEDGHNTNTRHKRSSKHAPTAMPANRAVGRYREVVEVPKIKSRDPRFDVTSGVLDRNAIQNRYSFLNDYQSDELTSLKKALKDPKAKLNTDQREKLQRKVVSLESKMAANKAREREEKVKREHRKQEREAVAQGKQPFYLKNSDVKKQALVDRFQGMKSRQKDKVIQRRRKKLTAKQRRDMPMDRRV